MNPKLVLNINWCSEANEAPALGKFFADNVSPAYISHSELQGTRAIDADHWQPGLPEIVADEIRGRVEEAQMVDSGQDSKLVFVGRISDEVVGLGMVSFFLGAQEPYAILEDLVVDQNKRAIGIGKQLLDWVEDQVRSVGCNRLFLESGLQNHHAHEFFKKEGFSTCSVVMVKPILLE
ncbi:MAG: GNAT family N-acetyltransferase [Nitrospira sp.]|nr:GNAT family N-acetyltransferase [Nitrospira sp.]